jgi:hypothetical protein
MSNAATIAANGVVHDTVAKLLKCHAINLSQIDPTTAADLTFAAAATPYSTSECQIQNFTAIHYLPEHDPEKRTPVCDILTLCTARYGREQGISIAVTMALNRLVKLSKDGHTDQIN